MTSNKAWVGMVAAMIGQSLAMWLDLGPEWQTQFVLATTGLFAGVAVWFTPDKEKKDVS